MICPECKSEGFEPRWGLRATGARFAGCANCSGHANGELDFGQRRAWKYHSENLAGNFHDAAHYISSHHSDWDVVAMQFTGNYTIVVWREEL
jgi:hypothetical protein